VAGVLAFVYRSDIETVLSDELKRGIQTHYPADSDPDTTGLRAAWDAVQTTVSSSCPYACSQHLACSFLEKNQSSDILEFLGLSIFLLILP
jgi:hypothetical protein